MAENGCLDGNDELDIHLRALEKCYNKLTFDITADVNKYRMFRDSLDLLTSDSNYVGNLDMIEYAEEKRGVNAAIAEIFDLLRKKDEFIEDLKQALVKANLLDAHAVLESSIKTEKKEAIDYKKRKDEHSQKENDIPIKKQELENDEYYRVYRDIDEDETEFTYSVPIRAFKNCLPQFSTDIQTQFTDVLSNLTCLSVDDKECIGSVQQKEGYSAGINELFDWLVAKDDFMPDLCSALEKCSLHETNQYLATAIKDETDKEAVYKQRREEFDKTNDASGLKGLAGENEGYKRTEVQTRKFIPRNYQTELASKAMEGESCLICAPTNSGKTFVSIMIAEAHLKKHASDKKKPRVMFLVPRFALLQQIFKQYKGHLPLYSIGKKSGSSPARIHLATLLTIDDIVIATAQILVNGLQSGTVKLSDFSLLILDECHHATKNHAYNKIMEMYIRCRGAGSASRDDSDGFPQVVGLTASPGAGRVVSASCAKDWILNLCSNLDARFFVTVKEHRDELSKFANVSKRATFTEPQRPPNTFEQHLNAYMLQLETYIGMTWNNDRAMQEYINHVHTYKTRFIMQNQRDKNFYSDHLIIIHEALKLSIIVRLQDGYNFLKEALEKLRKYSTQSYERELLVDFEDLLNKLDINYDELEKAYPNPKLVRMKETIMSNKRDCDKDNMKEFRAMIYTKTRQTTLALYNWMQADEELTDLNTQYLTGIHASVDEGGMTSESTRVILEQFEQGAVKVLVCTSVGEEGLNIPACRLVIRYNHVTNEISMIQSRGRIRERDGNEVVIGDSEVMAKDKTNVLLEEVMRNAMENILAMNHVEFNEIIDSMQMETMKKIRERELMNLAATNMSLKLDTESNLHCFACDMYACPLSEIRTIHGSNYINPNPSFNKKVKFKEHDNLKKRQLGVQKIHCIGCDFDWGNTVGRFPCIKISSFFLVKPVAGGEDVRTHRRQWKKVDYDVPALTADG